MTSDEKLLHKELSYTLNGILYEVHNELGRFANEQQVCDAVEKKLVEQKINYKREFILDPINEGEKPGRHRVDFIIDNKIVLETKTKKYLTKDDYYQLKRYLENLNLALGILANFREERVHPKRILNSKGKQ